ncbi:MAG: hypothetical protein C0462_00480 [Alcanivorax sp.]|nr:hypothetical protein [Alcanivorax sp.]
MYWLADHLGSHGYAVLAITPSNRFGTPPVWQRAHIAGFHKLAEENGRAGSPLFGQIDPDRRAIMGFSMGGGGTLLAAGEMGEGFATAIALAPWLGTTSPDYFNIAEPVLVLGSADDSLSPPGPVGSYFMSLPTDITRGLAIYRDANHADWMGSGNQPQKARFRALVTAWMNWLLREDESARGYFDGAEHDEHMAEDWFTRFEFRP